MTSRVAETPQQEADGAPRNGADPSPASRPILFQAMIRWLSNAAKSSKAEWALATVVLLALLGIVFVAYSNFLAVQTPEPNGRQLIGALRRDTLVHNVQLGISVVRDSGTADCTVKLTRSSAGDLSLALPEGAQGVTGAQLGFYAGLNGYQPGPAFAFITDFKNGYIAGPPSRDLVSAFFQKSVSDPARAAVLTAAELSGFEWVVQQSTDPSPAFIRFQWPSAIRHHGFAGRLLLIGIENPGVPAQAGVYEQLSEIQVFLPSDVTVTTLPTDARLVFSGGGTPIVDLPLTSTSQSVVVGWTDDRAESARQFWLLSAGVAIGVLGGMLTGFIFGPPRWRREST
jgi:hypothetical protein